MQVIQELATFLNISYEEAKQRVDNYSTNNIKWDAKTPEEVEKFYRDSEHYLYELVNWNYTNLEYHNRIEPLLSSKGKKILEVGAGIGSLCISLAYAGNDLTYYDISLKNQAFARQRFQDRLLDIPIVNDLTSLKDYDMVVAIDVLEHVHPDSLPKLLKDIYNSLRNGGVLYHRSTFKQQDSYPMHFDHSGYFNKLAQEIGFSLQGDDLVKGYPANGVQIGIPVLGDMPDEIFYSFLGLKKPQGTRLTKIKGVPADVARNEIIKKLEKDWLFFMDSDQTFHPESLMKLLSWGLPIVSGVYFKTPGKPIPHIYKYAGEEKGKPVYKSLIEEVFNFLDGKEIKETATVLPSEHKDLIECDGVGGGCLLVHKSVIDKITPPYFQYTDDSTGGEDFYFCRKVKDAGFKIFCDPGVICGHKQKDLIGAQHFMSWATDGKDYPYPWGDS